MKQISDAFARLKKKSKISVPLWIAICLLSFSFMRLPVASRPQGNADVQWGFYAHQRINRLAVYTLPSEMFGFYKKHIDYISQNAVNADKRRYAVAEEAPRHFIDLDYYPDSVKVQLSTYSWKEAREKIGEETLLLHGIAPWYINTIRYQLTEAFRKKDTRRILSLSADMGHYIADAHVPLHTTKNYNGQLTNQTGIHGFWESRLPEMFADTYDFFVGAASYEQFPDKRAWKAVLNAHASVDSVLRFEKELGLEFSEDRKYSFEEINNNTVKVYSKDFSTRYHHLLRSQVERQMRASIKMIGDLWLTCWVDAGQPELKSLNKYEPTKEEVEADKEEKKSWLKRIFLVRKEDETE